MSPAEVTPPSFRLISVQARSFRNLSELDFEPAPRFNVIHGDNGEGKSNLLELIDYLSTLRSFRGARAEDVVRDGISQALINAVVSDDTERNVLAVRLPRKGARQLTLNGKRPRTRFAYLKSSQVVLFHPGSLQLVSGSPATRREHLDGILKKIDPTFESTADAYQRALKSRNRLLSQPGSNQKAIVAYDELLASAGAIMGQARAEVVAAMAPRVKEAFGEFAGGKGCLSVAYHPKVEPDIASLRRALERSLQADLVRGYTTQGPHADELDLVFDGKAAKHYASHGQQRSIVLSLKITELRELENRVGRVPIFLLDDVSSELDRDTNRRLFSYLSLVGGQIFLTTTHPEFILLDRDRSDFSVKGGRISATG